MQFSFSTYAAQDSAVRRLDARVKIALLVAYSVCLFLFDSWVGMAAAVVVFAGVLLVSKVPVGRLLKTALPVYVLMALAVLFNAFVFSEPAPGIYPLIGAFSFTAEGFSHGCLMALRIMLLALPSLLVAFTTTAAEVADALTSILSPLKVLKVPVEDIAMMFSIALRFIPLTAEEFTRVRDAQWSRGARFDEGSLVQRLRAWVAVLVPVACGLFRRADTLADAMDARGYGLSE